MAIVKYGPTVTAISGTIAGTTFSANGSGAYARAWAKSSNPNSELQQESRQILSFVAAAWDDLTSSEQDDWDTWAALAFNERTNSVGETYFPSGFNQFCDLNSYRTRLGLVIGVSTPAASALTATVISTLVVDTDPAIIAKVTFPSNEYLSSRLWVDLAFTRKKAASPNRGNYRFMDHRTVAAGTEFDFTTEMQATFGDPTPGMTGFARCYRMSDRGQRGAVAIVSGLVT